MLEVVALLVWACHDFLKKMNSGFAVFIFRQVALAYTRHHEDATYQTCSQLTCIFLYKTVDPLH